MLLIYQTNFLFKMKSPNHKFKVLIVLVIIVFHQKDQGKIVI